MVIAAAIIILLAALAIAYKFSVGKSIKRKYIVWGLTTMLAIAPLFSWLISISYAIIKGTGWAGVALMMIMFPLIFLAGLVLFLVGVFRKKGAKIIE